MTRVAFQGERGAFSEDAVIKFFGDAELISCRLIADVFESTWKDEVNFGVVPIENSQAGSINETYDLLLKYALNISGEIILKVSHCLLALPGETLEGIKRIYSHPQALAQCEEFLTKLNLDIVPTYDTAGSAKMIKEGKLLRCAAIASERASQIYQLEILAHDIETNPSNYTKFVVISKERASRAERNKTSLIFATKNTPGALYDSLGTFATRDINLIKLESRPSKDKPWEYIFYVDLEGHMEDEPCKVALAELWDRANLVKILGSYPVAEE